MPRKMAAGLGCFEGFVPDCQQPRNRLKAGANLHKIRQTRQVVQNVMQCSTFRCPVRDSIADVTLNSPLIVPELFWGSFFVGSPVA